MNTEPRAAPGTGAWESDWAWESHNPRLCDFRLNILSGLFVLYEHGAPGMQAAGLVGHLVHSKSSQHGPLGSQALLPDHVAETFAPISHVSCSHPSRFRSWEGR